MSNCPLNSNCPLDLLGPALAVPPGSAVNLFPEGMAQKVGAQTVTYTLAGGEALPQDSDAYTVEHVCES